MTANEKALLSELLTMHAALETGSKSLQAMFERTLKDNQAVTARMNELAEQVERLERSLARLTVKS